MRCSCWTVCSGTSICCDSCSITSAFRRLLVPTGTLKEQNLKHCNTSHFTAQDLQLISKRNYVRTYFDERCAGGTRSNYFWATIKPFLSNIGHFKDPAMILSEDNKIISNQTSVSNVLNYFYVNEHCQRCRYRSHRL